MLVSFCYQKNQSPVRQYITLENPEYPKPGDRCHIITESGNTEVYYVSWCAYHRKTNECIVYICQCTSCKKKYAPHTHEALIF